ncbi:MAG: bifunctional glutamate N-acetyltransferase/amino-acid acetyltransferase ArgJ [Desulfobacterales bacterium]|nr:MAG: bifunctional glutamate N-acetyltransferase/amino-acid acetyltransferase ArgJ [Desulfobacterales bacterium]
MAKLGCQGFKAAGVACGLKKNGRKDLGLLYSERPANVAGLFTRNLVQAAPVLLDRQRVTTGVCRGLIVNSGNANCCTGEQGMQAALRMAQTAAAGLGVAEEEMLVASTGVIGEPLPVEKIEAAVPGLIAAMHTEGILDLAEAIMTTDTVPKVVNRRGELEGKTFTVAAVAKGAGMIRPDMATMLCFVMTDVQASAAVLNEMLVASVDRSMNRITVDGDTSTNDTVLLMANGLSGIAIENQTQRHAFQSVLDDVLITQAKWLIKDGEGATKLVQIVVKGAASDQEAHRIADTIANSNLTKTALFGEDANWGRILAAAGRAGVPLVPEKVDIAFGPVLMVQNGIGCGKAVEAEATRILKQPEFEITVDLKMGRGTASVFTCDFSIDYVKINANYRT